MVEQTSEIKVPKRILNTLLSSLTAGVVPRSGAPYIAIGRNEEIGSLLDNLDTVAEGGAFSRFLIGRYGSGKSFLIQLIRGNALDRGFITADADLSPERRLTAGNGAGLATYRELMTNLAVKASPDGNALPSILSRHFTKLKTDLVSEGILPESPVFVSELKKKYNIKNVKGHGQLMNTSCPGTLFPIEQFVGEKENLILSFQRAVVADGIKLKQYGCDGVYGTETEAAMKQCVVKRRLFYKYKNATKLMQRLLGITQDGLVGKETEAAIKNFQKQNNLTVDGCCGLNTWKKLLKIE